MRMKFHRASPSDRNIVKKGQILAACVLLAGIILLSYGYFGQNKTVMYLGLAVTLAGALFGLMQIFSPKTDN